MVFVDLSCFHSLRTIIHWKHKFLSISVYFLPKKKSCLHFLTCNNIDLLTARRTAKHVRKCQHVKFNTSSSHQSCHLYEGQHPLAAVVNPAILLEAPCIPASANDMDPDLPIQKHNATLIQNFVLISYYSLSLLQSRMHASRWSAAYMLIFIVWIQSLDHCLTCA